MTLVASRFEAEDSGVVLDRLLGELAIARQMLDEIQDDLAWAMMTYKDHDRVPIAPRRVTSLPLDPCTPDWAERVNRYSAADVVADVHPTVPTGQKCQGELF